MAAPFRTDLTAEEARALLDYRPETGEFFWKIARRSCRKGAVAGSPNADGYWTIRINRKLYYGHRLAWLIMKGEWPPSILDHEDTNPTNNKFTNLRLATHSGNHGNLAGYANNKSGFKGVSFCKSKGKWEAYISINCRKKSLGRYNSAKEAHAAYVEAAKAHFGEFARTS